MLCGPLDLIYMCVSKPHYSSYISYLCFTTHRTTHRLQILAHLRCITSCFKTHLQFERIYSIPSPGAPPAGSRIGMNNVRGVFQSTITRFTHARLCIGYSNRKYHLPVIVVEIMAVCSERRLTHKIHVCVPLHSQFSCLLLTLLGTYMIQLDDVEEEVKC